MRRVDTPLPGLCILVPVTHRDDRGHFLETFHAGRFEELNLPTRFVQINHSRSHRNVLRGLHFQAPGSLSKLVSVTRGTILDVAVDLRRGLPSFGRWYSTELSEDNHHQLFVPQGFAHGFCVLSDVADVSYALTSVYAPKNERAIAWNDPDLGIPWPVTHPVLSPRDQNAPRLKDAAVLPDAGS
jgi:dTDP-4-dehydrorhamnose 3,5-epimerase